MSSSVATKFISGERREVCKISFGFGSCLLERYTATVDSVFEGHVKAF